MFAAGTTYRRLLTHRRCDPQDAGRVRAECLAHSDVLPRWHQDDRGWHNRSRGIHCLAPEGAYKGIIAVSRDHWLTRVVPLAIESGRDVLKRHHVSPDALMAWARVKSGYADARSGRRCIVRPDTLASVLDTTKRHVQNCNRVARELGIEATVMDGRMLNEEESYQARRNGSRQRGLSTEVALTMPAWMARSVGSFTPTRGTRLRSETHAKTSSPQQGKKDAASPRRSNKTGRPSQTRQLARALARLLPWLAPEGARRLTPALRRFTLGWTAEDLVSALTSRARRLGRPMPTEATAIRTRPAALLAHMLRDLDPVADHPRYDRPDLTTTCSQPECDGHGWINTDTGRGVVATPCPDCPPSSRRNEHHYAADLMDDDPLADPPF